jgi:hypothetical protein
MFRFFHVLSPLSAAVLVLASPASSAADASRDPLNAKAPVPPAKYQSSLAGYRRFGDEKVAPWKDANETAARIGGWRAYARETQEGAAPSSGASAPAGAPGRGGPASAPAGGHDGHKK